MKLLKYVIPTVIAILALSLSFYTEKFFRVGQPTQIFTYYSSKLIYFLFIFFGSKFLYHFGSFLIKKDLFYLKWGRNFIFHLVPLIVALIFAWPGIFVWDEFGTYDYASRFILDNWQSYLTVYYYIINLYIFPSVGTIVLVNIVIFSLVSSWIITHLTISLSNIKLRWLLFLFTGIGFLSPAILFSLLMTYRSSMIASFELLLCGLLYLLARKKIQINLPKLILICLLTVILSVWRKEGIYHLILVPLFLLVFFRHYLNRKTLVCFFIAVLGGYFILDVAYSHFTNQQNTTMDTMRYELTAYMNPLSNILADKNASIDATAIVTFNKVIDVEKTKQLSYHYESPSFWDGGVREKFTSSDLRAFKRAYWKTVWANKDIFVSARLRTMLGASGFSIKGYYPSSSIYNYLSGIKSREGDFSRDTVLTQKLNYPINLWLDSKIVSYLEFSKKHLIVFWNFTPLLLILLVIFIRTFSFKNPLVWINTIVLARIPVLFVLEPGSYFMYYYPMYLSGVYIIFIYLIEKASYNVSRGVSHG
ncbi:hypothetical protein [Paenibacillus aestuarii]|uniref:Glycosyltransferase RgtA/B/C/D-like domain-containing protein n=1 Tax=Paenibacillus aestuarii TaxID=516965 RepID=A0ABW0K120_9BACL|nr:hypothetical protein [Paenibacillus aestuarii]